MGPDHTGNGKQSLRGSLSIRVCPIRDGTQGISLAMGERLVGQWTDYRARSLRLTEDLKVAICGEDGKKRYLFSVPGKVLSGEQVSDIEVVIDLEME